LQISTKNTPNTLFLFFVDATGTLVFGEWLKIRDGAADFDRRVAMIFLLLRGPS
jgi:hypothetical protein